MSEKIGGSSFSELQYINPTKKKDNPTNQATELSDIPQSKSTQTAPSAAALARGEGLYSRPKVSISADGGTTITGGDSNSTTSSVKGQDNASWISASTNAEDEAFGISRIIIDRQHGTPLTINDDSQDHPNHHVVITKKNSPLTLNTGNADGDYYHVNASDDSVTTINGDGKGSVNGQRDTVNYRPYLFSPNSTSQIKLENFNPSRTDLKIEERSLFFDGIDSNFSGTIDFSRKPNSPDTQFKINLDPSN